MGGLAIIRPHSWDLPLYLHVLGAMVAVGGLVLALVYLATAWRGESAQSFRAGYRALLWAAIPGYVVMRGAAEWIYSKEQLDKLPSDPSWVGIGFSVADGGLLLLLIATITAGVGSRRALATGEAAAPKTPGIRVAASLTGVMIVAYVIAVWAMTTKPT